MIGLDGRFARADRSCQDLEIHLVGSGLGTDLALPFPQKVDHGLFVPEAGVDLPACHEHFSSPVDSRINTKRGATQLEQFVSSPAHANLYSSQAWTTVCWEILPPLSSSMAMQNTLAPSG